MIKNTIQGTKDLKLDDLQEVRRVETCFIELDRVWVGSLSGAGLSAKLKLVFVLFSHLLSS